MLVLSRQRNQTVYIGDVAIVVVDIRAGQVRLGIEAPKSIPVWRQELHANTPGRLVFVPEGMECVLRPISAGATS